MMSIVLQLKKGLEMDTTTPFDELIGKTLENCYVSVGEEHLKITCTDGYTHYVSTKGDCCSESWWADILGWKAAIGGRVTAIQELEMPDPEEDGRTRQDEDLQYGYALETTKGPVTLVFRNSSNGYYGGWAEAITEKTVASDNPSWRAIETDDWSA